MPSVASSNPTLPVAFGGVAWVVVIDAKITSLIELKLWKRSGHPYGC